MRNLVMTVLDRWLMGTGGVLRVRGLLALGITGAVLFMYVEGTEVPEPVVAIWAGVVAFYFGTRSKESG